MKNEDIKKNAKENHVKLWQVAEILGISDSTLSRKLRKEFSSEDKEKVLEIINKLKEGDEEWIKRHMEK